MHLGPVQPEADTGLLLSALPHLRDLRCTLLDSMPSLLACTALRTLHLYVKVNSSTRPLLSGAQQFLRAAVADRLEDLTLVLRHDAVNADEVGLVLCAAGHDGTPSSLRSLRLTYFSLDMDEAASRPQPQLAPLASILHRLEHLTSLDLGGPHTKEFLEAMNGRVVPKLQRLRVYLEDDCWGGGCPHEWAHGEEPRALMRRYPLLHLVVLPNHYEVDDACVFCEANACHCFMEMPEITLFSHPVTQPCKQSHGEFDFQVV